MPITVTKRLLSGSTHGQGIGVSNSRGNVPITIHSLSTSATTTLDEIYLYAHNGGTAAAQLILEVGTSATNAQIWTQIPPQDGRVLVLDGLLLTGSACAIGALMTGANGTASDGGGIQSNALLTVWGFVNRIVQT